MPDAYIARVHSCERLRIFAPLLDGIPQGLVPAVIGVSTLVPIHSLEGDHGNKEDERPWRQVAPVREADRYARWYRHEVEFWVRVYGCQRQHVLDDLEARCRRHTAALSRARGLLGALLNRAVPWRPQLAAGEGVCRRARRAPRG